MVAPQFFPVECFLLLISRSPRPAPARAEDGRTCVARPSENPVSRRKLRGREPGGARRVGRGLEGGHGLIAAAADEIWARGPGGSLSCRSSSIVQEPCLTSTQPVFSPGMLEYLNNRIFDFRNIATQIIASQFNAGESIRIFD